MKMSNIRGLIKNTQRQASLSGSLIFGTTNSSTNKSLIKISIAATLLVVFLWMAIAQATKTFNNEVGNSASEASPSTSEQVPDPIAPVVESDAQHQPAPPSGQASSLSTEIQTSNGETTVSVNGQAVPVPDNGTVTQTMQTSGDGESKVRIRSSSKTQDSSGASSSAVNVNTSFSSRQSSSDTGGD